MKKYVGGGQPLLNKKAFTLIELLAVIVILAIIALIAVPIIINIINDSRESSNKRSIELYGKAVENALAKKQLDGTVLPDGEYELNNEGDVCHKTQTDKCITPEVNATKPISYTMTLTNGEIVLQTIQLKSGQPTYKKEGNGSWTKIEASSNQEQANNNEQQASNYICVSATTTTLGNVPQGNYTPGDEYICNLGGENRIFFVLGENAQDSTKVDLIMNQNVGSTVAWCDDEVECKTNGEWDNTKGPLTANAYLLSQTSNWEVTPHLPTDNQLESNAVERQDHSGIDYPLWIIANLNSNCYWTTDKFEYDAIAAIEFCAIYDNYIDRLDGGSLATYIYSATSGVRPVITISKSQLN